MMNIIPIKRQQVHESNWTLLFFDLLKERTILEEVILGDTQYDYYDNISLENSIVKLFSESHEDIPSQLLGKRPDITIEISTEDNDYIDIYPFEVKPTNVNATREYNENVYTTNITHISETTGNKYKIHDVTYVSPFVCDVGITLSNLIKLSNNSDVKTVFDYLVQKREAIYNPIVDNIQFYNGLQFPSVYKPYYLSEFIELCNIYKTVSEEYTKYNVKKSWKKYLYEIASETAISRWNSFCKHRPYLARKIAKLANRSHLGVYLPTIYFYEGDNFLPRFSGCRYELVNFNTNTVFTTDIQNYFPKNVHLYTPKKNKTLVEDEIYDAIVDSNNRDYYTIKQINKPSL